jgi:hypothetical protein
MIATKLYAGLGVGMLVVWLLVALGGWEASATEREDIPASVRQSPGGYRSYHFWVVGTHGGK